MSICIYCNMDNIFVRGKISSVVIRNNEVFCCVRISPRAIKCKYYDLFIPIFSMFGLCLLICCQSHLTVWAPVLMWLQRLQMLVVLSCKACYAWGKYVCVMAGYRTRRASGSQGELKKCVYIKKMYKRNVPHVQIAWACSPSTCSRKSPHDLGV